MKQTITEYSFIEAFKNSHRLDNFTIDGLRALFNYIEQYEEDCDTEIELDVIALCCEFTEYENLAELQQNYSDIESIDELQDNTTVIMIDDESFIIQDY